MRSRPARRRLYWIGGGAWAASTGFLLAALGSYPIELWDESRVAVNALEMFLTGRRLVVTYGFEPDLWNTKPPLLIWLMNASMAVFGPSEWALRLPSALAAAATVAVTMWFAWRLTGSVAAVVLTCTLLVTSRGFYGPHAAATGDYDALLTFCTTSYLFLLFFTLHRRSPRRISVIGSGLLIAAAVLTKGVAGLVPGFGVVLYLIVIRRWRRPFISSAYVAAAAIVLLLTVAFYGLREVASPGYIHAVLQNEVSGRYLQTVGGHREGGTYYLGVLQSLFSAGPLFWLIFAGLLIAKRRVRLGIAFSSCIAAAILVVLSVSATKLRWYIVPVYPFLALGLSLSAYSVVDVLLRTVRARFHPADHLPSLQCLPVGLTAAAVLVVAAERYVPISTELAAPAANYGRVFAQLHSRGIDAVTVVDGGDGNSEGLTVYAPRLRFYQLLWRTKSFTVRKIAPHVDELSPLSPGEIVVTCDPRYVEQVRTNGSEIAAVGGCISVGL